MPRRKQQVYPLTRQKGSFSRIDDRWDLGLCGKDGWRSEVSLAGRNRPKASVEPPWRGVRKVANSGRFTLLTDAGGRTRDRPERTHCCLTYSTLWASLMSQDLPPTGGEPRVSWTPTMVTDGWQDASARSGTSGHRPNVLFGATIAAPIVQAAREGPLLCPPPAR